MLINQNNCNTNFKARFNGEFEKVRRISLRAGLKPEIEQKLLDEVSSLCPLTKDVISLYFRKYTTCSYNHAQIVPQFRSGVKVTQNGVTKELNIDPRKFGQKKLFEKLLEGAKKLIKNQVKSEKTHIWYKSDKPKSWLGRYDDHAYYD